MGTYIARRALLMLPAMLGISIAIFLLLRLIPGSVIDTMLGSDLSLSAEARANLERTFGFDKPVYVQYLSWMADVVRGDLGHSLRTNEPVVSILLSRLPITTELAALSLAVATKAPTAITRKLPQASRPMTLRLRPGRRALLRTPNTPTVSCPVAPRAGWPSRTRHAARPPINSSVPAQKK